MRPSCPSSQVTVNGRLLIVRFTCPKSSPFPQNATDAGERPIDTSHDLVGNLFELRGVVITTSPADLAGGLEPRHRSLEPFNRRFELSHRAAFGLKRPAPGQRTFSNLRNVRIGSGRGSFGKRPGHNVQPTSPT
jgi:hypothetical protein